MARRGKRRGTRGVSFQTVEHMIRNLAAAIEMAKVENSGGFFRHIDRFDRDLATVLNVASPEIKWDGRVLRDLRNASPASRNANRKRPD